MAPRAWACGCAVGPDFVDWDRPVRKPSHLKRDRDSERRRALRCGECKEPLDGGEREGGPELRLAPAVGGNEERVTVAAHRQRKRELVGQDAQVGWHEARGVRGSAKYAVCHEAVVLGLPLQCLGDRGAQRPRA